MTAVRWRRRLGCAVTVCWFLAGSTAGASAAGLREANHARQPGVRATRSVIAAAGDIACPGTTPTPRQCHQESTARRIEAIGPDAVLALGDLQYPKGSYREFLDSYDASWGRFRDITYPSPGNHEYMTPDARGYFRYFGHPHPYFGFDLGAWHLISLDSQISMSEGSAQETWLESDLGTTTARCILAYWHRPLFASSIRAQAASLPLWRDLYSARADVVLNGHEHDYERFARMTPSGAVSTAGVREFVVGTGGRSLYRFGAIAHGSQFRDDRHFGVLRLTLEAGSYAWAFVGERGVTLDHGRTACH